MSIDPMLFDSAQKAYEVTLEDLDDRAQQYADNFHRSVIEPFCNRHNLRFWSGNGVWFFESPGGKTFEDPEREKIAWGMATGNAKLTEPVLQYESPQWVLSCGEADLPEFLYNYSEIHRLLLLNFMGGCLGFWINDFRPSSFKPDRPKG